ncbi:MAG: glycosyltransferase [Myxococcales bacterium]|nr:glycosyltransferase [Myxococcales bacterium]
MTTERCPVAFFSPMLADGGLERVIVRLLHHLDRTRFDPALVVVRPGGALFDELPADVPRTVLGAPRLAASIRPLARYLATQRPDVLFAGGGAGPIAVIARELSGVDTRVVVSERSSLRRSDRSRRRAAAEWALKAVTYRRADLVTAVSDGVKQELQQLLRIPSRRLRTLYNPIVDETVLARAEEPVDHPWFAPDQPPVLLAVGRLVHIKDYPTLFRAFARIRAQTPARLLVLGEGEQRDELQRQLAALGLTEAVQLHGFDPNPYRYMARATALVHASRAEGLPGVHIQAMACGTPVVSTDCDHGPREIIVRPGHDGILVPVGDEVALAEGVLMLLRDADVRNRMGAAAATSAQRFTNARTLAAYEHALAEA